ncbi:MAG TPA: hypothetical protein VGQ88_03405, partial [Burkholderiales bacterium]|nr:hypothetical protein [Burkholderiales bacterium]
EIEPLGLAPELDALDHARHERTPQDDRRRRDDPCVEYRRASAETEFAGDRVHARALSAAIGVKRCRLKLRVARVMCVASVTSSTRGIPAGCSM